MNLVLVEQSSEISLAAEWAFPGLSAAVIAF
jgi:hypothetical protein